MAQEVTSIRNMLNVVYTKYVSYMQNMLRICDTVSAASTQPKLHEANLDPELLGIISCEEPTTIFFSRLVESLLKYGQIADGRHALEAVLESARGRVGQNKRKDCDTLLKEWQEYQAPKGG